MKYLLIDGYNFINSFKNFFDTRDNSLEDCRDKLIDMLSNFKGYSEYEIIVVFDAYNIKSNKDKVEKVNNIKIVFTKENKTADNYIERFVYKMSKENLITVVTSDFLEQRIILANGGIRMPPSELMEIIKRANKSSKKIVHSNTKNNNTIISNLNKEMVEKLEKIMKNKLR